MLRRLRLWLIFAGARTMLFAAALGEPGDDLDHRVAMAFKGFIEARETGTP